MKKQFLIALLAVALASTMVACGDKENPDETQGDTTPESIVSTEPESVDETDPAESETETPDTDAPDTEAPETDPPVTETEAPETDPPKIDPPPETDPPETDPPETEDPNMPIGIYEGEALLDPDGKASIQSITVNDGFVTIIPANSDPNYYPFRNIDGGRYITVKYRAFNAEGMSIQIYPGSMGEGPSNDDNSLRTPAIDDGNWHLAVFDTVTIDSMLYDGEYLSYLRFDPLDCDYILDENGQPYKENGAFVRYPLPAGASIDIAYIGVFHTEEAAKAYDAEVDEAPSLEPEYIVTPEYLAEQAAKTGETTYVQHATGELKDGFITLTSTAGGDPYVTAINMGTTDGPTAKFLSIKYRTTVDASGQVFIGSGAGWTGQGDNPTFKYIPDGEWHLAIIDLNTAVTSLDGAATYLRYDFFTGGENESIDVAYIAFFNSEDDANAYEYGPAGDLPPIEHDYVADGLVSMYQGGEGTVWTDVIGANDVNLTIDDNNKLTADGLQVQGAQHYFPQSIVKLVNGQSFTVEILFGDFVCLGESYNTFMNSGNDNFALFRRVSSDELEFKFAANSAGDRHKIPGAQALLPNSLITVTYTVGGDCVIYINGEVAATKPSPNVMGADNLFIGHTEAKKDFNALYRSIRFYNRALSAEEVLANAQVDNKA